MLQNKYYLDQKNGNFYLSNYLKVKWVWYELVVYLVVLNE